jgi:hypothetical protein
MAALAIVTAIGCPGLESLIPAGVAFYMVNTLDYVKPLNVEFLLHHLLVSTIPFWKDLPWGMPLILELMQTEKSSVIYYLSRMIAVDPWLSRMNPILVKRFGTLLDLSFLCVFVFTRIRFVINSWNLSVAANVIVCAFSCLNIVWLFQIIGVVFACKKNRIIEVGDTR